MAHGQLAPILHYLRRVTSPAASGDIADSELLCRFSRHRDETAFAALMRRHGPMVLAVCRRVLRDGHTAEDAFQATFLVLARKAGSLAKPELLANWLYGVARRTAAKAKTEAAKRRFHERQAVRTPPADPSEELEWHDLRAVLDEEVSRLPERYRVPVVLCYLQGQTNAEAARRLGCSRGTVATLLARARDKLQRRLTQRGVGLSVGFALAKLTPLNRGGAVPLALEQGTVKAATFVAAGQWQAAGAMATQAVALAKGVSKGMLMEKLKIPAAILMMTAVLGTGAGVSAYRAGAQDAEVAETKTEGKPQRQNKNDKPIKHVSAPDEPPKDAKATYRTPNFVVQAPTVEIARQVGQAAEHNRKALAQLWLGKQLADWAEPCPVRVTIKEVPGSAAMFHFQDGVCSREGMFLEGPLDRIFADLLPHEMTHTILAEWRGRPVPRWADEGAATLSESAIGRARCEQAMERLLRTGHTLPLAELLPKFSYPKDLEAFYAQSLSLTDFLVIVGGRKKFLAFVAQGHDDGWDKAASVYGHKTVEEIEEAWLRFARMRLANNRRAEPSGLVASYDTIPTRPADKRSDVLSHEPQAAQGRHPTPRPAPASGEALPAQFKEKLPAGPSPIQVLVVLQKDRRLSVSRKVSYYAPQTETVTLKNGQKHRITYYAEKHSDFATVYDFQKVRVHDTKGRPVDANELRKRLRSETLALISADGRPVDPLHLRLYKEDTLVFVLPPEALPAVPGVDPIAPPAVAPPSMPLPPGISPVPPHSGEAPPGVAPPPPVDDRESFVPPSGT